MMTVEEVRTALRLAGELYQKGDFIGAIAVYDRLVEAPPWLVNRYMVRLERAKAYCKVGRFEEAERELEDLMNVLRQFGEPSSTSTTRYWYLVARYKGDEKKAMDEVLRME